MKFIKEWGSMLVTVLAAPFWLPGQSARKINQRSQAHANIYVAGWGKGAHSYEPCLWKNGTRVNLDVINARKDGTAFAVFVSGNDVYVSGTVGDLTNIDIPCYWKNGIRTDLPAISPKGPAFANCISVS